MPGFLKRFWYVLRGKTNRILNRMENPEEQLSVFVSELNTQVQDLQRSVAAAIADEKRLRIQIDGLLAQAEDWEKRAVLALEAGDESLAKEALVRKEACESDSLGLQTSWESQNDATLRLLLSLRALKISLM